MRLWLVKQLLKYTLHLKMHSSRGTGDRSEHRLCVQGNTAGTNTVSPGTCTPSILLNCPTFVQFSDSRFCVCAFSLCPTGSAHPFVVRFRNHSRGAVPSTGSVCTHGHCCSSFFQLPFLLCELSLFLAYRPSAGYRALGKW